MTDSQRVLFYSRLSARHLPKIEAFLARFEGPKGVPPWLYLTTCLDLDPSFLDYPSKRISSHARYTLRYILFPEERALQLERIRAAKIRKARARLPKTDLWGRPLG